MNIQEDVPDEFANLVLNFISRNRIGPNGVEVCVVLCCITLFETLLVFKKSDYRIRCFTDTRNVETLHNSLRLESVISHHRTMPKSSLWFSFVFAC